jgi:hypothetical protein
MEHTLYLGNQRIQPSPLPRAFVRDGYRNTFCDTSNLCFARRGCIYRRSRKNKYTVWEKVIVLFLAHSFSSSGALKTLVSFILRYYKNYHNWRFA